MTLSVLICTYNRPQLLEKSLAALERSLEPADQLVVVNGGDEDADRVVQRFEPHFREVKLIRTRNVNLATSRNVGLPHCTGDVIAMTDDDAEVFPDWITRLKEAHKAHPEAGAVGGMVIGTNQDKLVARMADVATFPSFPRSGYHRTLPGVNISYKREVVRRVGEQDPRLFRGEDVDFNWRVIRLGYKIYYDPEIKVYHHHRPTMRQFLQQHYMYGRTYYLVRRKWDDLYCAYPRELRRPRDFLKLVSFMATTVYEPLLSSLKMPRWLDKGISFPFFVARQLGWMAGVLRQAQLERQREPCG